MWPHISYSYSTSTSSSSRVLVLYAVRAIISYKVPVYTVVVVVFL